MTFDTQPDPVERYLHDYIRFLDGEGDPPVDDDLGDAQLAELNGKLALLRPASATVPAGAKDRIARSLGLDRAGSTIAVDGTKLKAHRQRAGMDLKALAAAVTAAGATVTTGRLYQVEKQTTATLDQETVTTVVSILGITVADIEAGVDAQVSELARLLDSPRVGKVIAEWARDHHRDQAEVAAQVRSRVLEGVAFRAEAISEDHVVDIVRAVLRRMAR
jgi:hypothetical protein